MVITKLKVQIYRGLHARNTTLFVHKARLFESEVTLTKNGKSSDGKKVMNVMDLAVTTGDEVTLMVHGSDEHTAIDTLKNFLLSKSL